MTKCTPLNGELTPDASPSTGDVSSEHGLAPTALARLAHELRTPLSAIAAAADIMHNERFGPIGDERYRAYSSDILDSARHALGVINSMLKPLTDPGPEILSPTMVFAELDLNDLVARVAGSVRALFEAAAIEAVVETMPDLPHVIADAVTVRQILLNLVTNAIRATQNGGRVTLSTSYLPTGPVMITVADTGIGMSQAAVRRLLGSEVGPSADAHPATRRDEGAVIEGATIEGFADGSGLGLPIVRRLAALNGAQITIDSQPGQGTRVTIAFEPSRVVPV